MYHPHTYPLIVTSLSALIPDTHSVNLVVRVEKILGAVIAGGRKYMKMLVSDQSGATVELQGEF